MGLKFTHTGLKKSLLARAKLSWFSSDCHVLKPGNGKSESPVQFIF